MMDGKSDAGANFERDVARFIIEKTDRSIFLTGKAGTGKTTFLKDIVRHTKKKCIVLAPTGIAAVNAGAMTIHSFFQFGLGAFIPGVAEPQSGFRINKSKLELIRKLELLIIDEVSMVRADLMDHMDASLRRIRKSREPFGGVQLFMIGDLYQLPPVAHGMENELLKQYYKTLFFFSSMALKSMQYCCIELKTVYRQSDSGFIGILNRAREGCLTEQDIDALNARCIPGFSPSQEDGYVRLMTHNRQVDSINDAEMARLGGETYFFYAAVSGAYPQEAFPVASELILRKGAQVMFVKNDSEHRFVNGTLGEVTGFGKNHVSVRLAGSGKTIDVEPMSWQSIRYQFDEETNAINARQTGQFTQYPLKLAWAITIHKSQGLTFDKAVIDISGAFSPGQAYVALSRCRTLEGVVFLSPVSQYMFMKDVAVDGYMKCMARDVGELAEEVGYEPFEYEPDETDTDVVEEAESRMAKCRSLPAEVMDMALAKALREWRYRRACEMDKPAFVVFSNAALNGIATMRPETCAELLKVPGIGPAKVEAYGADILRIVEENLRDDVVNEDCGVLREKVSAGEEKTAPKKAKPEFYDDDGNKLDSCGYTFYLYVKGLTVEEIAEARNLAPVTIENHLAGYVASGDLDVHEFVDGDTLAKIDEYCEAHPDETFLKPVYEHFNAEIPYSLIRFAMAAIKHR